MAWTWYDDWKIAKNFIRLDFVIFNFLSEKYYFVKE